jgi:outer membrane receptor protein involved in Fe transport
MTTNYLEPRASLCLTLFFTLLLAATLYAQSPQGTITGTVSDAQGGRVANATVTALHVATNQRFTGVSSSDGVYAIPSLPIGQFEVTVTASGFSTTKQTGVVLEVAQRLRLDLTLQVGEVSTTVTITEGVSRVQTEASSLGATIERKRIENLPLNGRHVLDLVKLVPGVQPRVRGTDGFAQVDNQAFSQISFNGGPTYGNQIYLDGGMNTIPVHNELGVVPLLDSVEEFKVHTNALAAEFGQSNGGVISFVTKSGTNEFHGSLYEFVRNDVFDARNAFLTQRDPITGRTKPVLRFNQYGGTFGGPLYLPRFGEGGPVFRSGRDRTFFFVGYERWNHRQANINRSTVPTPAERNGDFSNTRDGTGRLITIYDPATTQANPGGGFIRDPFPGNIIPTNRMDPLSLRVLAYMPLPNVAPNNAFTNSQNYLSLQGFPTDQGEFSARIDHNIGENDRIFGRYTGTRNTRMNRAWGLGPADTDARDDQRDNHNIIIGQTHVFSPTVLNEFRANATRQYLVFVHPSFDQGWPAMLGFPAIFPQDAFPPVQIDGLLAIGAARGGFAGGHRRQHTVQLSDSLTWTKGRHVIKLGTDQRWTRLNFVNRVNPSGNFTFGSGLTNNPLSPAGTGVSFATFLLGEVSSGSQSVRPFFSFHSWSNGSYVQDDIKVTRRLTLNLGLRYDLYSGPVERWNRSSNFDPFITNPETGLPGVLQYAGVTKDRHFTLPPKTNFAPRIGFAYDVTGDGKMAVRAGYGIIYSGLESGDTAGDAANSLGFSIDTAFVAAGGGPVKAFQFSQGPATLLQPRGTAGGPSAFRGAPTVTYQALEAPTPYVQQWNLTLQRELPWQWVVSAIYAGNRGIHLFGANYDLNQLDPRHFALGLALQDQVTNPFFGQIATGALSGRTVARSQLLRPYPDYLNIRTLANHGAASPNHYFQFIGEKRFSHGLAAMVSYTNSKLINDSASSNQGNGAGGDFRIGRLNRRQDRALDEGDVSQRLVVSSVYELPFGPGRHFLKGGVLSHVIGGWQLNTIVTWETGRPLVVRGANNFTGINWPDLVCNPTLSGSEQTADRWFKTECFRNPPNFVIGNVPRTLPNTRGPGYKDVSLSVFRNFNFTERVKMEFRGEAFNAFNFVNLNEPNTTFTPNTSGVNTNPNFGRILSSQPARRIQLGLRLTF